MAVHELIAVGAFDPTGDRLVATTAALVALAGVIAGGTAYRRGAGRGAVVAVAAGLLGLVAGTVVVATADGGPGTGNGIVGGYAAVVLGLVATLLGGVTALRARRSDRPRAGA